MESPPGYTSKEPHKLYERLYRYLDNHAKDIYDKIGQSAIAPSIEEAKRDVEETKESAEEAKENLERALEAFEGNVEEFVKNVLSGKRSALEKKQVLALLAKIRLIHTEMAKSKEPTERSLSNTPSTGQSAFFPRIPVKSGRRLNTRRAKKRNGSSKVFRNRAKRMSRRKAAA